MPPSNHIPEGGNHRGEDTIVVQSDNYWRNASSPESSPESETEPIVASLLARFQNAPPDLQLESPEPEDQEEQLPEQNARRSSNTVSRISRLPGAGTSEERLQQMPKLRDLPVGSFYPSLLNYLPSYCYAPGFNTKWLRLCIPRWYLRALTDVASI